MGIDRSELSPGLQQKIVYAGANGSSFEKARENVVKLMDLEIPTKQIERLTERIGRERQAQRDEEVERYTSLPLTERKDKPKDVVAPAVAVVGVDGGRLQILERSAQKGADATVLPEGEGVLPADAEHRGTHWREDKIAKLMTMQSEEHAQDPCPEVLEIFVNPIRMTKLTRELKTKKAAAESKQELASEKPLEQEADQVLRQEGLKVRWEPPKVEQSYATATRQPWSAFGPMVAALAWKLGFFQALRKAFLGDGSENNWTLWRNHFSSFTPILDIIHAISYVFAAAMAGRSFKEGWDCHVRWVTWVWKGEVARVIAELAQRQAELGMPQEGDGETHPRQIVSTALGYLEKHQDKMKYAEYRRAGLPITSSYVESAVKQFNYRVKGSEKFWTGGGVEAVLQLRGDYLSDGDAMKEFWENREANATGQRQYNTTNRKSRQNNEAEERVYDMAI